MAKRVAGNRPGEFGGVPGLYGNVDAPAKARLAGIEPILEPHQERMALHQTTTEDKHSFPSHGTGGVRVQ